MESHPLGSEETASVQIRERIRKCLEHGAPWDACDAFRDALTQHPGNAELCYLGALAHARAGAAREAHALLDRAQPLAASDIALLSEILSLRGRLWKDRLHRTHDVIAGREWASRARNEYLAAYELRRHPYPGVNAATLSLFLGEHGAAQALAREIVAKLAVRAAPLTCWDHATLGEAQLLLGEMANAREGYAAAYAAAPNDAGSIASMRRQVRLIARVVPDALGLLSGLPAPTVTAFAGHMIDAPDRSAPRFPAALEPAVGAAIRDRLARMHQPIVYTSAACGADLIAIEAALDLGAEVNVLLPFNRDDFIRTSVAVGGGGWTERFDAALSRASRVIAATEESHLGDDVLFEHAAMLVEGLTALRAAQLETEPSLLCVLDAAEQGHIGGTRRSYDRWKSRFGSPDLIDLARLRAGVAFDTVRHTAAPDTATRRARPSDPLSSDGPEGRGSRPRRTLKTLLFADFAGYSRLHDAYAPLFQGKFWEVVAAEFAASPVKPVMTNSWGDAIYAVFDRPEAAAEFALRLIESMRRVDWTAAGLSDSSQIRVALHAGPVFSGFDPIMGRDNYFGSSVTRAARIEPVTPPGMAYASEAFAASLAASDRDRFALEYVGALPLAKGYGESRIYRLDRR
ncbi:MAG TPA: adenylate/guanylate cyclase domain-containing protein [Casimicrobiaceae bacterium]|nr:adenylate/guanylate cyclase domain-containing protein [Casimicrobiaceae bacterium]